MRACTYVLGAEGAVKVGRRPRVDVTRAVSGARARLQGVAEGESAVGACVETAAREEFARRAIRARHAILLLLLCRRLASLACLGAGVNPAVAGPLLEKVTCSTPSLNTST